MLEAIARPAKVLLVCVPLLALGACASNSASVANAQATADQALATANAAMQAAQSCQSRCEAGFDHKMRK